MENGGFRELIKIYQSDNARWKGADTFLSVSLDPVDISIWKSADSHSWL
jgi:hypothetical protein